MTPEEVARVEAAVRGANPVPRPHDLAGSPDAAGVTLLVEHRRHTMTTPKTLLRSTPPPRRARFPGWAFAAGLIATILLVGVAVLFLRDDGTPVADEPATPTPVQNPIDSLSWSRISLGSEGPSLAITEGGPGFIGVGVYHEPDPDDLADGGGGPGWVQGYRDIPTVWTSPDGYEWSRVPNDEAFDLDVEIAGIAAGDPGVVAVAEHHVWNSPDGFSWSRLPEGTFTENVDQLRGVIAGGPGFVAFGEDELTGHADVWTSPDGLAWTRVPDDPAVFNASMHAMTVGGPGLVAVGFDETTSNPVMWTSPNGYTWVRVPHDPAAFGDGNPDQLYSGMRINEVVAGGPGLIAVGVDMSRTSGDEIVFVAAVWTSPDGSTWTRVPHDPSLFGGPPNAPFAAITDVAAVGDGFVAIGSMGEQGDSMWTSHDGTTWTRTTVALNIPDNGGMEQIIAGGPGAIILGHEVIEDYPDHRPPLIETVIWIGSLEGPTS